PRDFKSLASTIPPRPRGKPSPPAGARRLSPRDGESDYFDNTCPQADCQSLPPASVTLPSFSKNLLGTWKIAIIVPPFGHQATCLLPAGRQTNSPAFISRPASGPSLSTSDPSRTYVCSIRTCSWSGKVAPGSIFIRTVASPLLASNSSVLNWQPGKRIFSQGSSCGRTWCERLSST